MNKTSTYMTKKFAEKPRGCTEFQLHKNVLKASHPLSFAERLLDFTEFKLKRMIMTSLEADKKRRLLELLADYQSGKVAIAWQNGSSPIYINIIKEL